MNVSKVNSNKKKPFFFLPKKSANDKLREAARKNCWVNQGYFLKGLDKIQVLW